MDIYTYCITVNIVNVCVSVSAAANVRDVIVCRCAAAATEAKPHGRLPQLRVVRPIEWVGQPAETPSHTVQVRE